MQTWQTVRSMGKAEHIFQQERSDNPKAFENSMLLLISLPFPPPGYTPWQKDSVPRNARRCRIGRSTRQTPNREDGGFGVQSLHQIKVGHRHCVFFSLAPDGPSGRGHIQNDRPRFMPGFLVRRVMQGS